MSFSDRRPFSVVVAKNKLVLSGATDTMITRAPWPSPVSRYYVLRKAVAVGTTGTGSGGSVFLWDQDLSSATPAKRGSAGGALVVIPLASASLSGVYGTVSTKGINETPPTRFYAGITVQAPPTTFINLELEVV